MIQIDHISDIRLNQFARGVMDAAEILRVQPHLASCDVCRRKLAQVLNVEKAFIAVRQNFTFDQATNEPEHLTYEQLEFFTDDKLDEIEREIFESHLAFCGECEQDLKDLLKYREIAQIAPPIERTSENKTAKTSFWKKLFSFDSMGVFASVAAVLLIAILFGAWFLLRVIRSDEIVRTNVNQNAPVANFNAASNVSANYSAPENSASPQISPAPTNESLAEKETLYALSDGDLKIDDKGNLQGAENLSLVMRDLIRQTMRSGKVSIANHSLGSASGVLMSENNSNDGVPFGLETPLGKIIRETQPNLRWKPLKNAESYSVAIVDEKFNVVATSGKINSTRWKPSKPLARGATYSWQVTAILADGTETVSPSSPAPQARFRVLEAYLSDEIARLEKSATRSHLALGLLYAKAGLKREARAEFEKLVKANPQSEQARKLLQSVR